LLLGCAACPRCCQSMRVFASFGVRGFICENASLSACASKAAKNAKKLKKTVNNFHFSVVK
jgi:hypothetical protein